MKIYVIKNGFLVYQSTKWLLIVPNHGGIKDFCLGREGII